MNNVNKRLLIPTNDGINISPDFDRATAFRFLTVVNGSIKEDLFINKMSIRNHE